MDLISVITPTFRREDLLARSVQAVLAQQVDARIEHIVVNDAGEPLGPAPWQSDERVRIVDTLRTERSVARNTGAALSRGTWLYFLDDDDYPLPGAFATLLALAKRNPDAVHLYGGYEIFDEERQTAEAVRPQCEGDLFPLLFAGETFPLQASWLRRDAFFQAGCFDPLAVPAEDVDLMPRIARRGNTARTDCLVARVRVHHPGTTTTAADRATDLFRMLPERWLQAPGTFAHLRRHTNGDPFWAGRCARQYLITGARRAKAGSYGATLSRLLLAGGLGARHFLSPPFWRGLRRVSGA